jgi:hypothetical protein
MRRGGYHQKKKPHMPHGGGPPAKYTIIHIDSDVAKKPGAIAGSYKAWIAGLDLDSIRPTRDQGSLLINIINFIV